MLQDADALPQLIGDYKPVDQWQAHINQLYYRVRGSQTPHQALTFASADYRLAHALAADYFEKVIKRLKSKPCSAPLTVMEWGPKNGNLAGCFLSHMRTLDREGTVYPRLKYVLVDGEQSILDAAQGHPTLEPHRDRVETLCASVDNLPGVVDGTVDRIICNELWSDLPSKLISRKGTEIEEEFLRPNLSETLHAKIQDWSAFVKAFDEKDVETLKQFPPFFDDLVWEREYRTVDWKSVPYRKTITEFLKRIDEQVIIPLNVGAYASMKEAKRILAPDAVGFSSFDAGTADMAVLNDPEKPCMSQFGGRQSVVVNFPLAEAVAKQLDARACQVESQREFIGRSLGTNVLTLMDLLATHPTAGTKMESWEQDRLILKTLKALNETYESPYERAIDFPIRREMPVEERETLQTLVRSLKPSGVPDTASYLTEEELMRASKDLEEVGYDPQSFLIALTAPPGPVDYFHLLLIRR